MRRLAHLAPEELAGIVLLALVLLLVALRPATVTEMFGSPYATPHPDGGPARELVPDPPPPAPSLGSLPTLRILSSPRAAPRADGLLVADPKRCAGLVILGSGPTGQLIVCAPAPSTRP